MSPRLYVSYFCQYGGMVTVTNIAPMNVSVHLSVLRSQNGSLKFALKERSLKTSVKTVDPRFRTRPDNSAIRFTLINENQLWAVQFLAKFCSAEIDFNLELVHANHVAATAVVFAGIQPTSCCLFVLPLKFTIFPAQ